MGSTRGWREYTSSCRFARRRGGRALFVYRVGRVERAFGGRGAREGVTRGWFLLVGTDWIILERRR